MIGPRARAREGAAYADAHVGRMTTAELEPFLGRLVAVRTSASETALTGTLERVGLGGSTYQVVSADGEVPPVVLDAVEIVRVEG